MTRIAVVVGSVRPDNYTLRITRVMLDAKDVPAGVEIDLIDPAELDLRLPGRTPTDDALDIQERVKRADGVVLATPEYHGSYSSTMKLLIDNLGFPSVLKGKPVGLLGVAAGRIGAIKAMEHLRSVASHVGAIVLPGPVSVPLVRGAIDEQGVMADPRAAEMVQGVLKNLVSYIRTTTCPKAALEGMVRERD